MLKPILFLLFLLGWCPGLKSQQVITRGDTTHPELALVFTGHDHANGGEAIRRALAAGGVKASFFLTGDFYREPGNRQLIRRLKRDGHYLGAHSDRHLLYADWIKRDSLLVSRVGFEADLRNNESEMRRLGVDPEKARYFLPPYEWYNDSIVRWTNELGRQLINYSSGTLSHADYTSPGESNYRSSFVILESIKKKEARDGLRGFILLMHIGAAPQRPDPLWTELPALIRWLQDRGYRLVRVDELLHPSGG